MFAQEYADKQSHFHLAKYRDNLADEEDVTWLSDDEEFSIAELWNISLNGEKKCRECSYEVIKERCETLRLDVFETYKLCRLMTSELNKKE